MSERSKPVALVTGSASGMGKAVADRFLSEGWRVAGVDLAVQDSRHDFIPVRADITQFDALKSAVADSLAGERLSAVINAAGIFPVSNLQSYSSELYRRIFDVNVLGTMNVARTGRDLMAKEGGCMLFFASVDAFAVSPNQLLYSASKAAVVSLTKSLAIELVDAGIVVNSIAPGWVETEGTLAGGRLKDGVMAVPMKRAAKVEEVADWVWKLCAAPGYITGETMVVSGGVYMR
ncbi:SDR family NAD(P)-dependent oxidoreductase [Martelella alba]|uniref:SDR family oxidoreductase n=1 Tax=Martelella alba TaxID=2590451 RepID=A0ABY2SMQ3_9HYPH|nr:SDR family oxidoreductase [Martelella alba]TKI06995.1 SDR family oxidoreductase [Martelella alba]